MKLVFVLLGLICASQAINQQCAVELAKIGIDVTKLAIDISSAKVIAAALAAVKSYKELKNVIAACQTSEIEASFVEANLMKFRPRPGQASPQNDLQVCVNGAVALGKNLDAIYVELQNGQNVLDAAFIAQVVSVTESVDDVFTNCKLAKAEAEWNKFFPNACVELLASIANDYSDFKADAGKPVAEAKDLVRLEKDIASLKTQCPAL